MGQEQKARTQPGLFASALQEWLARAGQTQRALARQLYVNESTASRWLRGERLPDDPVSVVRLLIAFHHWLGEGWTVPEALDGIAPLGWAWEDVWQTLNKRIQKSSGEGSFRDWWQQGKPQPLPEFTPPLPVPFVPRAEQNLLQGLLTDWASWRQARWKAVILSGVAGIGKTTLLIALARDSALRHHFRDGILWLDGTQKNLLEQATHRVGLQGPPATRREEWARWAGNPHRRLLVVVDDALPSEDPEALIAPSGPQVVFALTTQKGPEVCTLLKRWVHPDQVTEVILQGLREEEGFALIQQVQERPIGERERETVRRVGHLLGWHPEGLRIAAGMAREAESRGAREQGSGGAEGQGSGWEEVLAFLEEEGLKGGDWDPLLRLLERQWERMSPERREWVDRLVWRTVRGGPLEAPLARAIWDVKPEVARLILRDLERTGLVEQVAVHPAEWWRPPEVPMWRVTPVVFRVRREKEKSQFRLQRTLWRARTLIKGGWLPDGELPPTPLSLALTGGLPTLISALFWGIGIGLAEGIGWVQGRRGRWKTWRQRPAMAFPLSRLQEHLAAIGLPTAEEMELLQVRLTWTAAVALVLEALTVISLIGLEVLSRIEGASLSPFWKAGIAMLPALWRATPWILAALWIWVSFLVAWLLWLCILYGVRTWDLALMVRLALALTRPLAGLAPVRRERERLREAWNRSAGRR